MENQGKKLAVLVGCLYSGEMQLYGCINDVVAMKEALISRFNFDPSNIEVLTDGPESEVKATGANIRKALNRMVGKAQNGDILFFQFSGHGTLVRDNEGEAIVPCDRNLITDIELRKLVNQVPKGATLTVFSDSCNSGGLIAQEKEQIGPSTGIKSNISVSQKSKFIPIESVVQHLSSQTGINSSNVGIHLVALFGSEASLDFRHPVTEMEPLYHPDGGILLSGCQKDESSCEVFPGEGSPPTIKKACGAFSNAVQIVLEKHEGPITNKELVISARKVLQEQKLDIQHPCLYCSDDNASATFLMQPPKF